MVINILAVDDVEANLFSLESLILGHKVDNADIEKINVIQCLSGEEALKIVLEREIDLIYLDVQMPNMDGFETAKFLRLNPKTKEIPIIFLTAAFKSEEFVKYGFEVGAVDYFTKPIEKYQFLNKLQLYINLFAKTKRLQRAYLSLEEETIKNKKQEQAMIEQSRLAQMGEMISMIAHQWRQPLGAIASTTVNLQMKLELESFDFSTSEGVEESKEYLKKRFENIESYVQSLTTTIDDFRNFYKPNKELAATTFNYVVEKALNIISGAFQEESIKVVCDYKSSSELKMYSNEMMQVILNILTNARDNLVQKNVKNPEITITTNENTLAVCDNGGGIPESIIGSVFDPYFSTKDEKNGTGLGLYMSKIIVEEHHSGKLHASNLYDTEGSAVGACFMIEIEKAD